MTEIANRIDKSVAPTLMDKIKTRIMKSASYKMYAAMYAEKEHKPSAIIVGDINRIRGFSQIFEEVHLPVGLKISAHSLAGLECEDIIKPKTEKEQIELLNNKEYHLVLGDSISLHLCSNTCEKVLTAFPLVHQVQIAEHLPFVGILGMDFMLEAIDRYYGRL